MAARSYDLTDEKEIKQYLRDIETEYSFQCYDQKEPDGCHRLGEFFASIVEKPAAGAPIFKDNCNTHKFPRSCFKYAQCLQTGKGAPEEKPNLPEAINYYEKSCDLDYPSGCYMAGRMRCASKEDDKQKSIAKGVSLLEKACNLKYGEGCITLSGFYLTGGIVEKNLKKAFEFASKGCELGHVYCCNNLSLMYRHGHGVTKNVKMANELKMRSLTLFEKESKISPKVSVNE